MIDRKNGWSKTEREHIIGRATGLVKQSKTENTSSDCPKI